MTIAMTARIFIALLATALAVAGCATRLVPAPDAMLLPGRGGGAMGEAAGVRLFARTEAWSGDPATLDYEMTPILVTVENGSSIPLRLRYNQFSLGAASGQLFVARAPSDITGFVTETRPGASVGFGGGMSWGFPGSRFGWDPFPNDPFYDPYFRRQIPLPTGDMVRKALPETVVEPGAQVSGFVYFEKVRGADRVTLHATLVNARTDERFGVVSIPFIVKK